jgi:hypothetical protein
MKTWDDVEVVSKYMQWLAEQLGYKQLTGIKSLHK